MVFLQQDLSLLPRLPEPLEELLGDLLRSMLHPKHDDRIRTVDALSAVCCLRWTYH